MKKLFTLTTLLVFMTTGILSAQTEVSVDPDYDPTAGSLDFKDKGWEIYGGYGVLSLNSVAIILASAIGGAFLAPAASLSEEEEDYDFSDSGVFNLGALYYFGDHLYAGAGATFQRFHALETDINFVTFMAEGGVQYGWERFKFYHALGAGLGWLAFDNNPYFAFNVTILGMKVRFYDDFWFYLESNVGQKGFFQGGLRYRF